MLVVVLLVAIGAALRFYRLDGRGFWLDEAAGAGIFQYGRLTEVVASSRIDDQMPLFQMVMWEVGRRISQSDAWLRAPSALAGTAAVYASYRLGRDLGGLFAGLVCGVLTACLPFALWYSQEARPYAFLMLFVTGQLVFALRALRTGRWLDFAGLAACTILTLYTHYTGLLGTLGVAVAMLTALGGQLTARRELRSLGLAAVAGAVVAVAYLPWLGTLISFLTGPATTKHLDEAPRGGEQAADLLNTITVFGFASPLAFLAIAGFVYCGFRIVRERNLVFAVPPIALLVPLAALLLPRGSVHLLLWPRYLAFLFPCCVLLAALGAQLMVDAVAFTRGASTRLPAQVIAVVILTLVLAPAAWSSFSWPKDGYREVSSAVLSQAPPGSVVLFVGPNTTWLDQSVPRYVSVGWPAESSVQALPAADVGSDAEAQRRLRAGQGKVFLVFLTSDDPYRLRTEHLLAPADQMLSYASLPQNGDVVTQRFVGVTVARVSDTSLSSQKQAVLLLAWAQQFDDSLAGPLAIVSSS